MSTWRQLFPDYFETLKTLPVFTDIAFREGVKESITCAWNDTADCFRELHHLNYALATLLPRPAQGVLIIVGHAIGVWSLWPQEIL